MIRIFLAIVFALAMGTAATAANPTHVVSLKQTMTCAGCDLAGAYLRVARIAGANFAGADLSTADLISADLGRTDLTGANLTSANLIRASLVGATLTGARRHANLRAKGPAWCCLFNEAELEQLVTCNPAIAVRMIRSMSDRIASGPPRHRR